MRLEQGRSRLPQTSIAERVQLWLERIIAVYCLIYGIFYWTRIVGFYDGTIWRFDLMPLYWQISSVSLAVLFPFAAIGLWMLASWGPVVWVLCAIIEIVMFAGFPQYFGARWGTVITHLLVAMFYAGTTATIYFEKRKAV